MSLAKMLAMWVVLASIFLAQGAKSRYEDASTGLLESDWYVAAQDLPMPQWLLRELGRSSICPCLRPVQPLQTCLPGFPKKGLPRTYLRYSFMPLWGHIVQVWIPSGAAECTWSSQTLLSIFFCLKSHCPLFPRVLFILWIPLSYCIVCRLCEHGLLMVAPPCSLFVPISASVHRRKATLSRANNNFMIFYVLSNLGPWHQVHLSFICMGIYRWTKAEQPYGNINNKRVRMSTLIAQNCGILISLILCWRPTIRLIVEQPKGSMLWKLPTFVSLIQAFGLSFVLTYLGFFGMDILNGSHLLTNMEQPGQSIVCKCLYWMCLIV